MGTPDRAAYARSFIKRSGKLTADERDEIVKLYTAGDTPTQDIAGAYGISESSVYNVLRTAGVPRRPSSASIHQLHRQPRPAPTPAPPEASAPAPGPVPQRIPLPTPATGERLWAVTYVVKRVTMVSAPTIVSAIEQLERQHAGAELEVIAAIRG